jgi:hypothetical protein
MKKIISVFLCVVMICLCFSGCSSSNELTEANVEKTVDKAFSALADFNTKDLKKYVDSTTLSTIITYADSHDQFVELGKAIFENLSYEITDIDLDNQTVTISVQNKDLYSVASNFASQLKEDYSTFQLLIKLGDDNFLDRKLSTLCNGIANAELSGSTTDITLSIEQGSKNLVLVFDDDAENAVSGGALSAIKQIYSI